MDVNLIPKLMKVKLKKVKFKILNKSSKMTM